MKTMKLKLLILLLSISGNLCAQNIQTFPGTYRLKGQCADLTKYNYLFPEERDVVITESAGTDLLFDINIDFTPSFKATALNDSLFVPLQSWENFDETQATFRAKGRVENDSLFLHYIAGGTFGIVDCDCKGERVTSLSSNTLEGESNSDVYFDPESNSLFILAGSRLEIIDVSGTLMYHSELLSGLNEVSANHFIKGVYLVRIWHEDKSVQTFKWIINKG